MNKRNEFILGILGGLGPMSSVYFYEMLTSHTKVSCDQEHINILLSSHAQTPDRTAYIMGEIADDPAVCMIEDAETLIAAGADLLVIPCNTAHYFYDRVRNAVDCPMINIIYETVAALHRAGTKKAGILATDGTIYSGAYQNMCERFGIACEVPSPAMQKKLMNLIYGDIKTGASVDLMTFGEIVSELRGKDCEHIILGCTELSLIKRSERLGSYFVDSTEILAWRTILACGKEPIGFEGLPSYGIPE
ncbi:MAG: amino acid racemase [Clostridia bacterium]|nr:amino acid racemase [Clostridia bacterium]MBQ4575420.1 amino acid racemase [Clostridia bacterium]